MEHRKRIPRNDSPVEGRRNQMLQGNLIHPGGWAAEAAFLHKIIAERRNEILPDVFKTDVFFSGFPEDEIRKMLSDGFVFFQSWRRPVFADPGAEVLYLLAVGGQKTGVVLFTFVANCWLIGDSATCITDCKISVQAIVNELMVHRSWFFDQKQEYTL